MRKRSKTVSSKELVVTALHVLVAWNDGRKPAPAEIQLLKEALPSAALREIHQDGALAVDHVVVVVTAIPALCAESGAAPQLEGFGAAFVSDKRESALDGYVVEAAANHYCRLACR
jgi:hypothetical protein